MTLKTQYLALRSRSKPKFGRGGRRKRQQRAKNPPVGTLNLKRFGHPIWLGARCICGYTETRRNGGFYDDVFLYMRKCVKCGKNGCDYCIPITPDINGDYFYKCPSCKARDRATWGMA